MKKCYIIQPGRIGDIIIVLPIAKYYADKGYDIYWFVYEDYLQMFEYVDYVKPIPLYCGEQIKCEKNINYVINDVCSCAQGVYHKMKYRMKLSPNDIVLDLSIGFSESKVNKEWMDSGFSFDEWKYKKVNVPFVEKYNLKINRKFEREKTLAVRVGIKLNSSYLVTHSVGSIETFCFDTVIEKYQNKKLRFVEIKKIKGFTVFDWIGIIEQAQWLYCVDSCVANLVNQLGICKNRRAFKPLHSGILNPKMNNDWIVI